MKKQIRIFMSGALLVIPMAVTIGVIVWIGRALGSFGQNLLQAIGVFDKFSKTYQPVAGWIGIAIILVLIYLLGLLANFWLFSKLFAWIDRMLSNLPGIKTIYESVRDLMKLFGGGGGAMGYSVLYTPPGMNIKMLGIVTNESPEGRPEGDDSVIVYLPLGYMIGGPIVYVSPSELERVDIPVEKALKLAATAFVGVSQAEEIKKKLTAQPAKTDDKPADA